MKTSTKGETPVVIEEVIPDDFDKACIFNQLFENIVPNLKISPREPFKLMQMELMIQS